MLDYLNALIWPVLLIVLVVASRSRLAELAAKLSGLEASTSGISATFDRSADEAAELTSANHEVTTTAPPVDRLIHVHATSYVSAREIGTHLANGAPVVLNVQDLSEADAKRIIDFCAGAAFITNGAIERVSPRRFMVYTGRAVKAAKPMTPDSD